MPGVRGIGEEDVDIYQGFYLLWQGQIFVLKFFLLTRANYSICLFFHGVVSLNLYFDAKVDFLPLY